TMHIQVRDVKNLPIILKEDLINEISEIEINNIKLAKEDWDSFEISADFEKHPFMHYSENKISDSYELWKNATQEKFDIMKQNEEQLNEYFINIYGLSGVDPNVEERDVSVRVAMLEREIKSFISYAVGCMFGRYSLDENGVVYAGGEFNYNKYKTLKVDRDNILPILPGVYFDDDIVSKFLQFIQVAFGEENLVENLDFIANAIGKKKGETSK